MPTYDYLCKACGHRLEIYQSITESAKRKCPACKKSKLERQIGSGAAILFKGSGFYQTDYRSESYRAGETAEKAEKSDSKPAAPADAKSPDSKAANSKTSDSKASDSKASDAKTSDSKPKDTAESKPASKSKDSKKQH